MYPISASDHQSEIERIRKGLQQQKKYAEENNGKLAINGILGNELPQHLINVAAAEVGGGGKAYKLAAERRILELENILIGVSITY